MDKANHVSSSDEMLRAAREELATSAEKGTPPEDADTELSVEARRGEPADNEHDQMRRVEASAQIARIRRKQFGLSVDGDETAVITTKFDKELARPFLNIERLRVTKVDFDGGERWRIDAVPRKERWRTTIFGNKVGEAFRQERIVRVTDDTSPWVVAETVGVIEDRGGFAQQNPSSVDVECEGDTYSLSPVYGAWSGSVGDSATIQRTGFTRSRWSIEARRPLPLAVVLLHWHVLMGDYTEPSRAPGG